MGVYNRKFEQSDDRIRIALCANTAWYLFNFRAGLIKTMVHKGWKVVVIAPQDNYFERLKKLNCTTYHVPIDNKGTNLLEDCRTLVTYWRIFRRVKPDVVLSFTVKPILYGTLISKLLAIRTINTVTGLGSVFISNSVLTRFVSCLYRLTQRWAVAVVFQNKSDLCELVSRGLVPERISVQVPGSGINLSHFKLEILPKDNPRIFLLIGRLLWDKGVAEYVEAARRIKVIHPSACFQILGPTRVENPTAISRKQLEDWNREGVIDYLGVTDDVRRYIAGAHCVVLPSYREGLSRALLEGAAMGRPLVTTDVSGCRDVVDDGINGFLCNVQNVSDLTEKLLRIYSLPYKELLTMAKNSRAKVEREFDENFVVQRYIELIENSVGV